MNIKTQYMPCNFSDLKGWDDFWKDNFGYSESIPLKLCRGFIPDSISAFFLHILFSSINEY